MEVGGVHQGDGAVDCENAAGKDEQDLFPDGKQIRQQVDSQGQKDEKQEAVNHRQGEIPPNQPVDRPAVAACGNHCVGAWFVNGA